MGVSRRRILVVFHLRKLLAGHNYVHATVVCCQLCDELRAMETVLYFQSF